MKLNISAITSRDRGTSKEAEALVLYAIYTKKQFHFQHRPMFKKYIPQAPQFRTHMPTISISEFARKQHVTLTAFKASAISEPISLSHHIRCTKSQLHEIRKFSAEH